MIELKELAEYFNERIAGYAENEEFVIRILPDKFLGRKIKDSDLLFRNNNKWIVYLVLATEGNGTLTSIEGMENVYQTYRLTGLICLKHVDSVRGILERFALENVATSINIGGYTGVVTFDMPSRGLIDIRPSFGETADLYMSISVQSIKDGLISNQIKHTLNGEEIKSTVGSGVRELLVETDNLLGVDYLANTAIQTGYKYQFTLPYTKSPLCVELMNAYANGGTGKVYKYTYDDGIVSFSKYVLVSTINFGMETMTIPGIMINLEVVNPQMYEEEIKALEDSLNGKRNDNL